MLHPVARSSFDYLWFRMKKLTLPKGDTFDAWETFRSPSRHAEMLSRKHTEKPPWTSAHCYGLAMDYCARTYIADYDGDGTGKSVVIWNVDWDLLHKNVESLEHLYIPDPVDAPWHVEHVAMIHFQWWR